MPTTLTNKTKLVATGLLAALAITVGSIAKPAYAIEDKDKAEIEAIIHEYLVKNPEILVEMQQAFEKKQAAAQQEQQKDMMASKHDEIFNSKFLHVVGNPEGKTTVVEFFDYNCGYCQKAMEDMNKIIANDKDVKFVVREFPVLGPDSQEAHQVAVAFGMLMPEKYADYHRKLLGMDGRKNGETAMALAIEMGADEAKLKEKMNDPEIAKSFEEAYELANGLGITGTPSYVVGDQVVFGAIGYDQLKKSIDATRK